MKTLKFGDNAVNIHDDHVDVVLPDGAVVPAVPHITPEYYSTTSHLGYGEDIMALCVNHEIVHTALCHWLGLKESPTMRSVASFNSQSTSITGSEEDAVMAIQRFANLMGVDLVELFRESN